MKKDITEVIYINKLVHGGQGLGVLADGRKVFAWNALPGEKVKVRITKNKKDYAEGIAEEIIEKSVYRINPKEDIYLATSPWQILDFNQENKIKSQILKEAFEREKVDIGDISMITDNKDFNYRNKIEFSFYGDDNGLHYAFYNRGTHQKQIVEKSELALPVINRAASDILKELNRIKVRASDLKSIIFRATQNEEVAAALFVKSLEFPEINLPSGIKGLKIFHSNPKSPASVATSIINEYGSCLLADSILNSKLTYDVIGFFQVNIPVFNLSLNKINEFCNKDNNIVDMYSGVGSIGLSLDRTKTLVELDPANVVMARHNAELIGRKIDIVEASSETSLRYITNNTTLIIDPPRSGLHKDVIKRINDSKPVKICYLSCNPATQARDIALIMHNYEIDSVTGYNFFPRTPHIESLVLLNRK